MTILDASNSTTYMDDIDNQTNTENYIYNSIGQLTKDKSKDIKLEYNHFGLVSKISELTTEVLKIKYEYNERAQKIKKNVYAVAESSNSRTNRITYYMNDAGGNVLGIYEGEEVQTLVNGNWSTTTSASFTIREYTIYGMGRVGVQQMSSSGTPLKIAYEITDYLGNIRAVVSATKVNGQAEVISYADYYAHGSTLPGRNYVSNPDYRYSYQGQEKDENNKWIEFDLLMYDANLGRWMSPDPFGEFHSPYLAMGNDPINRIDPTGGYSGPVNRDGDGAKSIDTGDGFEMLDALMAANEQKQLMNEQKSEAQAKIDKATTSTEYNAAVASYTTLLMSQNQVILSIRTIGMGYGAGNPLVGASPAISASGKPINKDAMMRESMALRYDNAIFYTAINTSTNEFALEPTVLGRKSDWLEFNFGANSGGDASAMDIYNGLNYFLGTTASLLNENATRNVKALEDAGAYWVKLTGKYTKSVAREISNNNFTAKITEGVGKKLFYVGAAVSVYNFVEKPSWGTLGRGTADITAGYIGAFVPGGQVPALIYFGGMFIYDLATAKP